MIAVARYGRWLGRGLLFACLTLPLAALADPDRMQSLSGLPMQAPPAFGDPHQPGHPGFHDPGRRDPGTFDIAYYIGDLKPSFPDNSSYSEGTALTDANYRAVIQGLQTNAHVNGVRMPIIAHITKANGYARLYKLAYYFARQIGLVIYASPDSVGMSAYAGWSNEQYATWLADYANSFRPEFLSPFNESSLSDADQIDIVQRLRPKLAYQPAIVGPDDQRVEHSAEVLAADPTLLSMFDVIGSHNADYDTLATSAAWQQLVTVAAGRPVWSSENPDMWMPHPVDGTTLPSLKVTLEGGVSGLVSWLAKPGLVDDAGHATHRADDISRYLSCTPPN